MVGKYIFSHFVGCLFILLIVSFAVQSFSLLWSHLFIFAFVACTFGVILKKNHCHDLCQGAFFLLYSKSFVVSGLTFESLIHFQFFCE